ncbi:MAG TPA: hypothetical protein VMT17_09750 [Anaeromyxobacteraceae bacterium]|nr:hypothetical protein [Anaeromyxobacteraceae bacterium]
MGALPAVGGLVAGRELREGAQWFGAVRTRPAPCERPGCGRPRFAGGLCGLHALGGRYRTVAVPGGRLAAARVERPPRILVEPPPPPSNG